jgi:hypothetical protein
MFLCDVLVTPEQGAVPVEAAPVLGGFKPISTVPIKMGPEFISDDSVNCKINFDSFGFFKIKNQLLQAKGVRGQDLYFEHFW